MGDSKRRRAPRRTSDRCPSCGARLQVANVLDAHNKSPGAPMSWRNFEPEQPEPRPDDGLACPRCSAAYRLCPNVEARADGPMLCCCGSWFLDGHAPLHLEGQTVELGGL